MEADSTTHEKNSKLLISESCLPFTTCPGNYELYKDFVTVDGNATQNAALERQIVERLQQFGLLRGEVKCPSNGPDCAVLCKNARVVDRMQWVCSGCGKKQAVRDGSFFFRLPCSLLQALQIILAWCEDADINVAAEHFGVKLKLANHIYDRLDELAIREYSKQQLGGDNSVVLAEMYPDCMNRLSPDTTEQPHNHRILMLADTNHIPTYYRLHLIDESKKGNTVDSDEWLESQVQLIVSESVSEGSLLVRGHHAPPLEGAVSIRRLTDRCEHDMEHFLSTRIWRQAISLCQATRDFCAGGEAPGGAGANCAAAAQKYLRSALYRLRYGDGFYRHMLQLIADEFTTDMP